MKVAVFLTNKISPSHGGGFSYTERLIQGIDSFRFDNSVEVCFAGRLPESDVSVKRKYHRLSSPFIHRLFHVVEKMGIFDFLRRAFGINLNFAQKSDTDKLRKNNVQVILYLKQAYKEVHDFPFISMNWDIGHKSSHAFPEFVSDITFSDRNRWYDNELQQAFAVISESASGKDELVHFCNIHPDRVHVVPLFPGKVVELNVDAAAQLSSLQQLKLKAGKYFYYPAQYWAHKNHYNLLHAFRQFKERSGTSDVKLVLSGSDQGNKSYVQSVVKDLLLESDVQMLGFISNEAVYTLYRNAIALVMPTFLGPTNMPLLEAQMIGVPVICSDFAGHREICRDAALYVNPESSLSIAEAMLSVADNNVREELMQKAKIVSGDTTFTLAHALKALNETFLRLRSIRNTFP